MVRFGFWVIKSLSALGSHEKRFILGKMPTSTERLSRTENKTGTSKRVGAVHITGGTPSIKNY